MWLGVLAYASVQVSCLARSEVFGLDSRFTGSMALQDLTKSSVHPMGGQAYLSLENSEDPFLHGIKFTAMPPSKRFREMEQLSGGEKVAPVTCMVLAWTFRTHG